MARSTNNTDKWMDRQTGQMDKRTSLSDHLIKLRNYTDQREIVIENTECQRIGCHHAQLFGNSFDGMLLMSVRTLCLLVRTIV